MATTIDFELPEGLEDKKGEIHRSGVMRRVRCEDLVKVANDARMKRLRSEGHKVPIGAIRAAKNAALGFSLDDRDQNIVIDPIAMQVTEAAMNEANAILLSQVIMSLGNIPANLITPKVLLELYPGDMNYLVGVYQEFNSPEGKKEEKKDDDQNPQQP